MPYPTHDEAAAVRMIDALTTFTVLATGAANATALRLAGQKLGEMAERSNESDGAFYRAAANLIATELPPEQASVFVLPPDLDIAPLGVGIPETAILRG